MKLKLNEILWEITPECNRNCKFCGSKQLLGKSRLDNDKILQIAQNIATAKPGSVTITGGEPATIGPDLLYDVTTTLGVPVKIVSNGSILLNDFTNVLNKFTSTGISINDLNDINRVEPGIKLANNPVVITNFGKHNIWEFNTIESFVSDHDITAWQIQLTMGEDIFQLPPDGIRHLYGLIGESKLESYVVLADNLQQKFDCPAGLCSCSVTYDGNVIACLAERVYCDSITIQGNLFEDSLTTIWQNSFKDCRFGERKCCRDHIVYPHMDTCTVVPAVRQPQNIKIYEADEPKDIQVVLYGCCDQQTFVYGAWGGQ